ncbi:hypothetical protein JJJ17_20195 [Paracoccus caeni]|uniref:Uncharacterized protein n=1 Tax=Paracoccus caeni TaxID=657651 RepID=A0A934W2Y7_9RHOB|nr:hypothetical protein [Paracoccus caeni]MBK4218249.1 hypothetical protein [Paracoccus caeni]
MIEKIQDASPAQLLEVGFSGAYQAQVEYHANWRVVQRRLEEIRGDGIAHDAGDGDVYFDLLLRQMEDEQAAYIRMTGEPSHPHSRTRMQIQLTRYWIVSVGEMLRATRNKTTEGSNLRKSMTVLVDRIGAVRMMLAKQDVQIHQAARPDTILSAVMVEGSDGRCDLSCERVSPPNSYQVRPIVNAENGSVCFPVYDPHGDILRVDDRRAISDLILSEFSE